MATTKAKGGNTDGAYRIDDDIPMPRHRRRGTADTRFPWESMKPGQSFFVPNDADGEQLTTARMVRRMGNRAHNAGQRLDRKFRVRPWREKDVDGVRIWREI